MRRGADAARRTGVGDHYMHADALERAAEDAEGREEVAEPAAEDALHAARRQVCEALHEREVGRDAGGAAEEQGAEAGGEQPQDPEKLCAFVGASVACHVWRYYICCVHMLRRCYMWCVLRYIISNLLQRLRRARRSRAGGLERAAQLKFELEVVWQGAHRCEHLQTREGHAVRPGNLCASSRCKWTTLAMCGRAWTVHARLGQAIPVGSSWNEA